MSGEQVTERHDVVIIGAGQAGLAAGYYLAKRGIQFLILEDHERIGDNWRTPVLVVGASHSGADIAVEAAAGGHRTVLAGHIFGQLPVPLESRRGQTIMPIMFLLAKYLLTIRTPIGRKMAPRIRMGGGPLLRVRRPDLDRAGVERSEARVQGVSDGKPVLGDGRAIDVANVVWCTGFRPDFRWIEMPIVDADGWPVQTRGVVDSVPGLYFLGLLFQYSFTSMLVGGASRDAAHVVDRIAERAATEPSPTGLAARVARS